MLQCIRLLLQRHAKKNEPKKKKINQRLTNKMSFASRTIDMPVKSAVSQFTANLALLLPSNSPYQSLPQRALQAPTA